MVHTLLLAGGFLLMVLTPCLIALRAGREREELDPADATELTLPDTPFIRLKTRTEPPAH